MCKEKNKLLSIFKLTFFDIRLQFEHQDPDPACQINAVPEPQSCAPVLLELDLTLLWFFD
jgi:hypothetical protein